MSLHLSRPISVWTILNVIRAFDLTAVYANPTGWRVESTNRFANLDVRLTLQPVVILNPLIMIFLYVVPQVIVSCRTLLCRVFTPTYGKRNCKINSQLYQHNVNIHVNIVSNTSNRIWIHFRTPYLIWKLKCYAAHIKNTCHNNRINLQNLAVCT